MKKNCTFENLINNQSELIEDCKKLCNDDNHVFITYEIKKDKNLKKLDLYSLDTLYLSNDNNKNLSN